MDNIEIGVDLVCSYGLGFKTQSLFIDSIWVTEGDTMVLRLHDVLKTS